MKPLYPVFRKAWCMFFVFLFLKQVNSQPILGFSSVASGFVNPVDVVPEPGSNRMFVVQQNGAVRIVDGTTVLPTPFMNINSLLNLSSDERGLLSLAFHPDYLTNRYLFVYYTNTAGDITVAQYRRDVSNPDIVDAASGVVLLNIPKPFDNHNGGKLNFGPDGKLYFGTGDGGNGNDPNQNAQNGNSLLGKMIRLDVDNFTTPPYYTIPPDNPFVANGAVRDEIWAIGLRNPWRWTFDKLTGDMWIADVGQGDWEEVNHTTLAVSKGANYGWRCREGNHPNPGVPACTPTLGTGLINPIFEYGHDMATGGFAITGGYGYHGSVWPALDGYYICADYVSGNVWLVRPDGSSVLQAGLTGSISAFAESGNGELFALSRTGALLSINVSSVLPVSLVAFTGDHLAGRNELKWKTAFEENTEKFIVEYSANGTDYLVAGEVAATSSSNGSSYSFVHYTNNSGVMRYRLRVIDIDQESRYSPVILLGDKVDRDIRVYPTVITGNAVQVTSGPAIERVDVFAMDGRQVFSRAMNGTNGYFSVPLPSTLQRGIYLVRLYGKDVQQTEKIMIR